MTEPARPSDNRPRHPGHQSDKGPEATLISHPNVAGTVVGSGGDTVPVDDQPVVYAGDTVMAAGLKEKPNGAVGQGVGFVAGKTVSAQGVVAAQAGHTVVPGTPGANASESFTYDPKPASDQSSLGFAPTLVGQLHIQPRQTPFGGHGESLQEMHKADTSPDGLQLGSINEKTFISQLDSPQADPGATVIGGAVKKDSEDFFDTLQDMEPDKSDGRRGYMIGDYQIVGELGRGGMGVVYKAKHRKLNRLVALKMILAGKHSGNEALGRFIAEAQAVAKLQHPGIVQIFDIGEHDGLPYFSLEFVEGKDLHKDLNGLPRDARRSAEMVEKLAHAMQYAHDHSILHRDLKPANVLLDGDGNPKITDFGLAKNVDAEASGATSDGTIMGSPSYMPPEQARGENSSMTPRSDLYSLGAILYQMLTARPPFVAERPLETVLQVINNEPVSPRDLQPTVPVDLDTICMKALQKDPSARYDTCADLAADLRRFINGEPILARPVSRLERIWRWCKRNPRVAIPSGLASLFIMLTAVISTLAWNASAAAAIVIAQERDNVKEQRDEADKQKGIALVNEAKAKAEKEEADRQRILANEAQLQAEKNEEIARKQALLALGNIQLFLTEIDDKLKQKPGTDELRISLLQVIEKEWDKLDVGLTGGLRGEAIPTVMTVRYELANAWVELGRLPDADKQFSKLYDVGMERLEIKNRNDATRFNQAQIALASSRVRNALTGNPVDGDALREEALALIRDVIANPKVETDPELEKTKPQPHQLKEVLCDTLLTLGNDMNRRRDFEKAELAFRETADTMTQSLNEIENNAPWFAGLPDTMKPRYTTRFQQVRGLAEAGLGSVLFRTGRTDEAVVLMDKVIAVSRESLAKAQEDVVAKNQLRIQLSSYGRSMILANRLEPADRLLSEAMSLGEEIHSLDPKVVDNKARLGSALYYLGVARDEQNFPDAVALLERSRIFRAEAVELKPTVDSKMELMLSEARVSDPEAARKLIDELGLLDVKNGEMQFDRARALAQLSRRAEGDQQSSLRAESLTVLRRAVADGYVDPLRIRSEPDLKPLHGTDEFKTLVTELESNVQLDQQTPKP